MGYGCRCLRKREFSKSPGRDWNNVPSFTLKLPLGEFDNEGPRNSILSDFGVLRDELGIGRPNEVKLLLRDSVAPSDWTMPLPFTANDALARRLLFNASGLLFRGVDGSFL